MNITHLDHLVLTVANIEITLNFYQRVLGMEKQTFASNRVALKFGNQKINLHQAGNEPEPKATMPLPGSADLCFVAQSPLSDAMQHVRDCGVDSSGRAGGAHRCDGADGVVLFRDPDLNLIELCPLLIRWGDEADCETEFVFLRLYFFIGRLGLLRRCNGAEYSSLIGSGRY